MASLPGFGLMEGSGSLGRSCIAQDDGRETGTCQALLSPSCHPGCPASSLPGVNELPKSIRLKGSLHVLVLPWADLIFRTLHTEATHLLNYSEQSAPRGHT